MRGFSEKDYKIFEMFSKQWALATAGTPGHFNSCTIAWGAMGTLWSRPVITVYLHPSRYTCGFFKENGLFTVSFYPESCKKALGVMGSKSGRDCDKPALAGLTPEEIEGSVTFAEAELTFVCRKLCQLELPEESLDPQIREYYKNSPKSFPVDENGDWHAHWMFAGEIIGVLDKR
jgi:flavin reductase (DIM6/NTAB) family NADH-FMN oxidoreductase RutF